MKWLRSLFRRKTETIAEDGAAETPQKTPNQPWRFGVAGNITKTHYDDEGILRYGSKAFGGGAKVYLCGKYWTKGRDTIGVVGLNRYKRMVYEDVPPELIENVRCTKVYKPSALRIMGDFEFTDFWWDNSPADGKDTKRFVKMWHEE